MRRVVSVSLGSPERDWAADLSDLGVPLLLERQGVGLDYDAYVKKLADLDADPEVAAIGLGGINRYLFAGQRKYEIRKAAEMAAVVRRKPVCDGSGMKEHWEPEVVRMAAAAGTLKLRGARVLMVCAADRWGMARALCDGGGEVVLGDLMFALGAGIPLRSLRQAELFSRLLLPVMARCVPFEWLYPIGEARNTPKYAKWYRWADVLAGDYKFISRHMPSEAESLAGKTLLTNTTTPRDVEDLRRRGVSVLITTTPSLGGRSFGTNLVEAAAAALSGRSPDEMTLEDYRGVFSPLGWGAPRVQYLQDA